MRIWNNRFSIFSYPLVGTARTLGQLPFKTKQVFKEIITPLGRCFRPGYFQPAGNGIPASTGTKAIVPAETL